MNQDRSTNSGFTVVVAAAVAAAVAYWILSAEEAKTLPFAIAQYVLLASVLVGGFGDLVLARARVSR
ncbi:MAG: hypothetical protein E7774_00360 [Bradyrhizobium sp.]|nr:MAG: hypothetical protein E7774_00360 [Bradyrhizobium sp.]